MDYVIAHQVAKQLGIASYLVKDVSAKTLTGSRVAVIHRSLCDGQGGVLVMDAFIRT